MSLSAPCRRLFACLLGCGAALASANQHSASNAVAENTEVVIAGEGWIDITPVVVQGTPSTKETTEQPSRTLLPEEPLPKFSNKTAVETAGEQSLPIDNQRSASNDGIHTDSATSATIDNPHAAVATAENAASETESEDASSAKPRIVRVPHGFVPVSLEERLQSLRMNTDDGTIITESAATVDAASIMRAVDEAFAEKTIFAETDEIAAVAGQAAEAAGRTTAELLINPPGDPFEAELLSPSMGPYDQIFLEARDAYLRGDIDDLRALRKIFNGYPLEDYLDFWTLVLELKAEPDAPNTNIKFQDFITAHKGDYLAESAATLYLREVGGRINQTLFESLYEGLVWGRTDVVIRAWRIHYQLTSADADLRTRALQQAKILYRDADVRNDAVQSLGDEIVRRDRGWAWERVIILLQKGHWDEVKRVLPDVPRPELPASIETLHAILDNPTTWFNRTEVDGTRTSGRLGVFAALRLARSQIEMAAKTAMRVETRLGAFWRALIWSRIGFHSIVSLNPNAPRWYARADRGGLDLQPLLVVERDMLAEWEARAALRAGNFYSLGTIIERMPEHLRRKDVWTYWRARAYLTRGLRAQADPLLRRIAHKTTFYGRLSADALGIPYGLDHKRAAPPSAEEIAHWNENPSLKRAMRFYRMHLYWEGHREWNWAMRNLKGRDFVVLAEWARHQRLVHRMINTSLRSGDTSLIEQRYPMPHRTLVERVSNAQQLPPAWVYGLIRQESRFIPTVSSSVGAQGLMQVMPSTAAWIANRIGVENYHEQSLTELEMNIVIGTAYLRMLYAELDQSYVLATAAYNAGPARARVWRATLKEPIEAAAFIETIPFYETRDYVKNVLANMLTYSLCNDMPIENFTRLIGRIVPASPSKSELP